MAKEKQTPYTSPRNTRQTRSNSIQDIGTYVRKKFHTCWREGRVTHYNTIDGLYKILYEDGETNEYTAPEMCKHYKKLQQYSSAKKYDKALRATQHDKLLPIPMRKIATVSPH